MPALLRDILLKLCRREDLTRDEATVAFGHVMGGGTNRGADRWLVRRTRTRRRHA